MIKQLLADLQATPWGIAVRESTWLFPTIESVHVLALVLVVGSIMVVDLRLLNLASRQRSVRELTSEVLPWTLDGLCRGGHHRLPAVQLLGGALLRNLAVRSQDVHDGSGRPSTWRCSIWVPSAPSPIGIGRPRRLPGQRGSPAAFRFASGSRSLPWVAGSASFRRAATSRGCNDNPLCDYMAPRTRGRW